MAVVGKTTPTAAFSCAVIFHSSCIPDVFCIQLALMTFMHEAKAAKRNRTVHNPKKSIAGNFTFRKQSLIDDAKNLNDAHTTLCSDEILYHRDTYVATSGRSERLAIRHHSTPHQTTSKKADVVLRGKLIQAHTVGEGTYRSIYRTRRSYMANTYVTCLWCVP
ncbi:hypothetical protein ALC62_13813 [Cyphomyrmex costatus]|uniref:Uncharacterized protein n=1 Tax=Cyphomyrmex costatus TaxID=456900 RepID=A0A195C440_9HYME|nr:hypothetical protein ALC62_13813 [Cyphomyrmex costatus]